MMVKRKGVGISTTTIGLVTIGQSPRPDIRDTNERSLGPAVQILEAGALDGFMRAIQRAPRPRYCLDARACAHLKSALLAECRA